MSKFTTQLTETKPTEKLLAQMPIELREKALKKALGRGVRVMAKEARRQAPRDANDDDGVRVSRSIRTGTRVEGKKVIATTRVTGLAASYASFLEFGHRLVAWGEPTSKRVDARPYFRPAADETEDAQKREVISTLKSNVSDLA